MIIFLYGEDTFRSRRKLKEIKDKFRREVDPAGSSITLIDGEAASLENINEVVAAPSLFTKRRMVVVEDVLKNKSKEFHYGLEAYLKKQEKKDGKADTIMLFWDETEEAKAKKQPLGKYLSKQQYAQYFKPLSNTQATNWVKEEAKRRGAAFRQEAAVHLTSLFGNDLWQMSNEINKLVNFKRGRHPELIEGGQQIQIEVEDVDNLVRGSADENIFALTDAISQRNQAQAARLFEQELEAGVTEAYLLTMVIRQFRIMLQVREALNQGQTSRKIINALKLHPFVVQKAMSQVRNFSLDTLKYFFKALVEIDYKMKTGQAEAKTELSLLIAKI